MPVLRKQGRYCVIDAPQRRPAAAVRYRAWPASGFANDQSATRPAGQNQPQRTPQTSSALPLRCPVWLFCARDTIYKCLCRWGFSPFIISEIKPSFAVIPTALQMVWVGGRIIAMTQRRGLTRVVIGALVTLLGCGAAAWSQPQIDPLTISDGLRAIFHYGSNNGDTNRLNANTVTITSGTIGGTYVQMAADLASVLDGDELRVLPIVGRGSVQNLADILFVKGVDLGIVRSDTLDYLEKTGYAANIKKQFGYITKLYNEEMHVIAPKRIRSLANLNGKTVSVDLPNGGTFITCLLVFERLGIKPNLVYIEERIAFEK